MLKKTVESFSDEDLKRLKEKLERINVAELQNFSFNGKLNDDDFCELVSFISFLKPLIFRLETAESALEATAKCHGTYCTDLTVYMRWRKAAGKDGR